MPDSTNSNAQNQTPQAAPQAPTAAPPPSPGAISADQRAAIEAQVKGEAQIKELEALRAKAAQYEGVNVDQWKAQNEYFQNKFNETLETAPKIVAAKWDGKEIANAHGALKELEAEISAAKDYEAEMRKKWEAEQQEKQRDQRSYSNSFVATYNQLPPPKTPAEYDAAAPERINTLEFGFHQDRAAMSRFMDTYQGAKIHRNKPK